MIGRAGTSFLLFLKEQEPFFLLEKFISKTLKLKNHNFREVLMNAKPRFRYYIALPKHFHMCISENNKRRYKQKGVAAFVTPVCL